LVALGYELLVAVEEIRTGALVDDVLVAVRRSLASAIL
jgi:hypothetical protein